MMDTSEENCEGIDKHRGRDYNRGDWKDSERCPGSACPDDVDMDVWMHRRSLELQELSLRPLKEDLADWLNRILGLSIDIETFLSGLETGTSLCTLAGLVHISAEKTGVKAHLPQSKPKFYAKAKPKSWYARDNASSFIEWCKELGVKSECLFESDDLVMHRSSKAVVLCLLEVSRIVWRYGIDPPDIVKIEKELEIGENVSQVESRVECVSESSKSNVSNTDPPFTLTGRSGTFTKDDLDSPDVIQVGSLDISRQTADSSEKSAHEVESKLAAGTIGKLECPDIVNDASLSQISTSLGKSRIQSEIGILNASELLLQDYESQSQSEQDLSRDIHWNIASEYGEMRQESVPVVGIQRTEESVDDLTPPDIKSIDDHKTKSSVKPDSSPSAINEKGKAQKTTEKLKSKPTTSRSAIPESRAQVKKQVVQKKKVEPENPEPVDMDTEIKRIASEMQCQDVIERIKDGKYRIFGNNVFIRILKQKHLMVRVGGGWQVLEHYLERQVKMKQQKQS